mgnify:CR=1 FL=1
MSSNSNDEVSDFSRGVPQYAFFGFVFTNFRPYVCVHRSCQYFKNLNESNRICLNKHSIHLDQIPAQKSYWSLFEWIGCFLPFP